MRMLSWTLKTNRKARGRAIIALAMVLVSFLSVQTFDYFHGADAHESDANGFAHNHINLDIEQTDDCSFCKPIEIGNAVLPAVQFICQQSCSDEPAVALVANLSLDWVALYANRGPPAPVNSQINS